MYTLIFLVVIGSIRFVILLLWPMVSDMKKAPYVPSFNSHLKLMAQHLKLTKWKKILDLWCWDGKALRFFVQTFWLKGEWYDINPFAIRYGKIINYLKWIKWIKFTKSKFEAADLSKYDYIYTYLFPNQMAQIEDRIFLNIKKETIIISNSFQFKKHKPYQTIKNTKGKDTIFLYRK